MTVLSVTFFFKSNNTIRFSSFWFLRLNVCKCFLQLHGFVCFPVEHCYYCSLSLRHGRGPKRCPFECTPLQPHSDTSSENLFSFGWLFLSRVCCHGSRGRRWSQWRQQQQHHCETSGQRQRFVSGVFSAQGLYYLFHFLVFVLAVGQKHHMLCVCISGCTTGPHLLPISVQNVCKHPEKGLLPLRWLQSNTEPDASSAQHGEWRHNWSLGLKLDITST